MDHAGDPPWVDVVGVHQPADAIGHALRRVTVGSKDLQADEPARAVVQCDDIRKGAANIDANCPRRHKALPSS
ncbi:hypothetical protein D3C71_2121710 [compost metagenome]